MQHCINPVSQDNCTCSVWTEILYIVIISFPFSPVFHWLLLLWRSKARGDKRWKKTMEEGKIPEIVISICAASSGVTKKPKTSNEWKTQHNTLSALALGIVVHVSKELVDSQIYISQTTLCCTGSPHAGILPKEWTGMNIRPDIISSWLACLRFPDYTMSFVRFLH